MTRLYITKIREHEYLLQCVELGIERELFITRRTDYHEASLEHVIRLTQTKLSNLQ